MEIVNDINKWSEVESLCCFSRLNFPIYPNFALLLVEGDIEWPFEAMLDIF